MGRLATNAYTFISEREVVGSGLASNPAAVAWVQDVQRAAFEDAPADIQDAQDTANIADEKAVGAQASADAAQTSADSAGERADTAQGRADDAYALADGKVTKNVGPVFAAPIATASRAALPAYTGTASAIYTQVEVQALMDQVATLTRTVAALIEDGRGNQSLTN